MTKQRLLMVDDDEEIRSQMRWALASDYEIVLAEDRASALAAFRTNRPAVVLLDLGLPPRPADPTEGINTLTDLLTEDPKVKVIIISGQSERTNAIRAVGEGAYDFLAKPVEMTELKIILKRAFHVAQLERELVEIQQQHQPETFEGLLGTSQGMLDVFAAIRKVATTDASVLILGESGTGKEMAALAIHRRSARKSGPFVAINCSAIPETVMEAELFGHEKGAFTDAKTMKKGLFEVADQGTIFFDEISTIAPETQAKLLRVIQEREFMRLGGTETIKVDVRILAACKYGIGGVLIA